MNCSNLKGSSSWKRNRSRKKRKHKRSGRFLSNEDSSPEKDELTLSNERTLMPVWFWSNYYKTLVWQNKHKAALWKSYAVALEEENKFLINELRNLENLSYSSVEKSKVSNNGMLQENKSSDYEEEEGGGIEFEMSEEMMKFFEQSFRHKLEMKKIKEGNSEKLELEVKELKEAHQQREKEMKLLYGDGSCMIIGMETAVQLSFDKYCDRKSPKYWPNIPLNL